LYQYARKLFEEQRRAAGASFDAELRRFRRLNRVHAGLGKFHAHSLARFLSLFRMPTKQKLPAK
jgi:hypothetical protein